MLFRLFLAFLFLVHPASSQVPDLAPSTQTDIEPIPPNPLDLKKNWWDFFDVEPSLLPDRTEDFSAFTQKIIQNTPETERVRLSELLDRIESNLGAYVVAKSQPEDKPAPLTPIADSYRVSDIIQLNREIRNREILLQTDQEDLTEKQRQITSGEARFRDLSLAYAATEPRSEEKLVKGLELINFGISLELAMEKRSRLENSIEIDKEFLRQKRSELETARQRITSDLQELEQSRADLEEARALKDEKAEELREREANSLTLFDFSQRGETPKLRNQLLDQKLSQAAINEALATNRMILNDIELELVEYLNFPSEKEFEDLIRKASDWNSEIRVLRQKLREWELEITRDIQRAQEWLSINIDDVQDESSEIKALQESILEVSEQSVVLITKLSNEIRDTEFLLSIVNNAVARQRGEFYDYLISFWEGVTMVFQTASVWLSRPLFKVGKTVIDAWGIINFFIIIAISVWLARLLKVTMKKFALQRQGIKLSLLYRVNRLFQYFIIALGIIFAMTTLGFDFSNLVLIAGALGVGLGFGLQNLFNNFVSGIVILFENQLKVGDYIELESGVLGEVKEINVRSTYIRTNDGIAVMVPNSELTVGRVINWTHKEPFRRVQVGFSVAYASDKEKVKSCVLEAVNKVPLTLKKSWAPEPRVHFVDMGPNSLEFKVVVWVDDIGTKRSSYTKSHYLWAIHDALIQNNIRIPFPQLDLHVESILEHQTFNEMIKEFETDKSRE